MQYNVIFLLIINYVNIIVLEIIDDILIFFLFLSYSIILKLIIFLDFENSLIRMYQRYNFYCCEVNLSY